MGNNHLQEAVHVIHGGFDVELCHCLIKICEDILEVLDKHLIASAQTGESKVFYHKMYAISL